MLNLVLQAANPNVLTLNQPSLTVLRPTGAVQVTDLTATLLIITARMLTKAVILVGQTARQATKTANLTILAVRQTSRTVKMLAIAVILVSQAARQTRKMPKIR